MSTFERWLRTCLNLFNVNLTCLNRFNMLEHGSTLFPSLPVTGLPPPGIMASASTWPAKTA